MAFTVIKLLGAAYLAYLAWQVVSGAMLTFETRQLPRDASRRLFLMGLASSGGRSRSTAAVSGIASA